jgi:Leucine-rich repeat (LRR) protein
MLSLLSTLSSYARVFGDDDAIIQGPFPWQSPTIQALFFVGSTCICAEMALRASHSQRGIHRNSAGALAVVCIVSIIALIAAPTRLLRHQRDSVARDISFSHKKCTNLAVTLNGNEMKQAKSLCPGFFVKNETGPFVQPARNLTAALINENYGLETEADAIKAVLQTLARFRFLKGLDLSRQAARFSDKAFNYKHHIPQLFNPECFAHIEAVACEITLLRCTRTDCVPSLKAQACGFHTALFKWFACADAKCSKDRSCKGTKRIPPQKLFEHFICLMDEGTYNDIKISAEFARDAHILYHSFADAEVRLLGVLTDAGDIKQPPETCDDDAFDDTSNSPSSPLSTTTTTAADAGTVRVRCDGTQYTSTAPGAYYYDCGPFLAIVFALLSVCVASSARGRPHLAFVSSNDMYARLASFALFVVTSTSTFIAGQYFENALQTFVVPGRPAAQTPTRAEEAPEEARAAVASMLYVWSTIYYTVSLLCFRNSFLLVLAQETYQHNTRSKNRVVVGGKLERDEHKNMGHAVCASAAARRCVRMACNARNAVTSSRGRYNVQFLLLREFVESIVQILGIADTAAHADVSLVSLRSSILCLNLILLPLLGLFVSVKWGRLAALVWCLFAESVFDRVFTVVGVFIQLTQSSSADAIHNFLVLSRGGVWEQVVTFGSMHLPALLPAAYISVFARTALISLSRMRDEAKFTRTKSWRMRRQRHLMRMSTTLRHQVAARVIQRWMRRTRRTTRRKRSTLGRGMKRSKLAHMRQALPAWVERVCQYRDRFCTVPFLLGAASVLFGVVIWAIVDGAIRAQADRCEARVGAVARCMRPRVYFPNNGLFGQTECGFDLVQSADCAGGALGSGVTSLPAAPEAYRQMVRLTHIDMSGSIGLERLPWSWSLVPNLTRIDVSRCSALRKVPPRLCAMPSSLNAADGLNVTGTPVSRVLNWSGQLDTIAADTTARFSVSPACAIGFETLASLILSHNNLTHKALTKPSFFQELRRWPRLSYLDVSHNQIHMIDSALIQLTHDIEEKAEHSLDCGKGVNYDGNPIQRVILNQVSAEDVVALLSRLFRLPACGDRSCTLSQTTIDIGFIVGSKQEQVKILEVLGQNRCALSSRITKIYVKESGGRLLAAEDFAKTKPFEQYHELRQVSLSSLNFSAIPDGTFAGLERLSSLTLVQSDISETTLLGPAANGGVFATLTNLHDLSLDENGLTTIEGNGTWFAGLGRLKELTLASNQISELGSGAFRALTGLNVLDLAQNKLTSELIKPGAFEGLSGLTQLSLSKNMFTSLPDGIFDGMPSLLSLSLTSNDLQSIGNATFSGLTRLTELVLSGNMKLNSITRGAFAGLTKLRNLTLPDNTALGQDCGKFGVVEGVAECVFLSTEMENMKCS